MKNYLRILLMITFLVTTQSTKAVHGTHLISDQEMKLIISQAHLLLQNGATPQEVLTIFEKNLEQEEFSVAKQQAQQTLILVLSACAIGLVIGGAVTYSLTSTTPESDEVTRLAAENTQLNNQVAALNAQLNQAPEAVQPNRNNIDLADLLRQCNEQDNINGIRELLNNPRVTGDRQIAQALMRIYRNS